MVARLVSLRLWLLVAMVVCAAAGLAGAAFLFQSVQESHTAAEDRQKASAEAHSIAGQIQAGADRDDLLSLQALLRNDQVTVVRDGRVIFQGPAHPGRRIEVRARAPFTGGFVRLTDYSGPSNGVTLQLALITGGVLLLVIAAAVTTATLMTRAVRAPIGRAIAAADRVSHGEFSARMGSSGPEEFMKLGRAFDGMAARLERADRDQRQFLADVAHEIATPLNSIAGFALALADGAAEEPEQREEAKALIESQTARLSNMLQDLRQLTRLDLAEGIRPGPVALAPFARGLVSGFRREATEAGLELTFSAQDEQAFTDARLLEMIGSNLISNAIRYTPAGGRVEVRLQRQRDNLLLSVRDTGVGIAPQDQRRVFERLYRVDSTRDRATGGTGLGLAIAARAARNLGGYIELESTLGKGSEFRVIVPARIEPEPGAQPPTGESAGLDAPAGGDGRRSADPSVAPAG
jgi:signal transduction histidine kinase